jgi:hypothetical protein
MKSEQTKEEIMKRFKKFIKPDHEDAFMLIMLEQALDQYGEAVRKETIELTSLRTNKLPDGICNHCYKPIKMGANDPFCDHLYYPDNCEICRKFEEEKGL